MRRIDYSYLTGATALPDTSTLQNHPEYIKMKQSFKKIKRWLPIVGGIVGFWLAVMGGAFDQENLFYRMFILLLLSIVGFLAGREATKYYERYQEKLITRYILFSQANALDFAMNVTEFNHPGLIFSQGDDRKIIYRFTDTVASGFEIGNFEYVTGSGDNRSTTTWGYVSILLERNVPHMILDATQNNAKLFGMNVSNLPTGFKKDQVLELEGDFNSHFTLYAPKEYERDALYIFTPDLMALLIDETAQYDVETIDNRLYIYSSTKFDFNKQHTFEKIFSIVDIVGKKAIARTDRYVDARHEGMVAHQVSQQGQRLKTGVQPIVIVLTILFGGIFLLQALPFITILFNEFKP